VNNRLEEIAKVIKKVQNIAILPHLSADGDALGSSFALSLALSRAGKSVKVYLEEDIPSSYDFLPGKESAVTETDGEIVWDVAIAVDSGDIGRIGERQAILETAKITINIDHHYSNTEYCDYNFVNPDSAAAAEIIYSLICLMDIEIDTDIASCLYVALLTDTGGFKFSNTSSETLRIASELIKSGIDLATLNYIIFDATTLNKVKLTGRAIESLEIFEEGKIALITISRDDMKKTGANDEDCEGIVNIGRNIKGVEVSVMMRETEDGKIKVSLRSANYYDVSAVAASNGGGGHKRAAGCVMDGPLESAAEKLLKDIVKDL
jgi:phosphoesterase RecJ-like protein